MHRTLQILPDLKRKIISAFACAILSCAAAFASVPAQETASDSAVLFRFVPGRLMFYYDYLENDRAIWKADSLINANIGKISAGEAVVRIRGFCTSWKSDAMNRISAKNRSNQVKSWYIVHSGMKEEWFRTENSIRPDTVFTKNCGDLVALIYIEYLKSDADTLTAQTVSEEKPARPAPIPEMPERQTPVLAYEIPADPQMPQRISPSGNAAAQTYSPAEKDRRSRKPLRFNVKTNMLYDVAGFPSLEVEIPFGYRWSLNLEGAVAWWSSYKRDNFYQLDLLSPEVRWWFGQKSRWHGHYIGAFGILGLYDLEWKGGRGYQGEYWSAGFSYGYMFPIGRKLSLEAGIGLGFMQTGYEEYLPQDEHYVYQQSSRTNYWGPVKLKLGLVWRIGDTPTEKRKKGRTGL